MKKLFICMAAAVLALSGAAFDNTLLNNDDVRQALYGALDQAVPALKKAPFGKNPVAILPMKKGHALVAGRLKAMLAGAGFVCVEGKDDPMWKEIIKEIENSERKEDILSPETVVRFGKLKAAKILLQCTIRALHKNDDRIYAELEMCATEVASGRILWGSSFAYRHYTGKELQGIIHLDNYLRLLLKKNFGIACKSLTSPAFAKKLNSIKTVTVIPLSGDIDSYITGLAIEMLSHTRLLPRNPRIPSLALVRATARDKALGTDAIFYGSVRALHTTKPVERTTDKKAITSYNLYADIQLFLENAWNGNILWSRTITLSTKISHDRDLTVEELAAKQNTIDNILRERQRKKAMQIAQDRKDKVNNASDIIKEDLLDNWKKYALGFIIFLGVILVLFAIVLGIKALVSYNNIR